MHGQHKVTPHSWLAFELSVLRRQKFSSVTMPFTPDPALGAYLKRWDVRVLSNDPLQSAWVRAVAEIANNGDRLSADDVNVVLEDAYVPGYRLNNQSLTHWFSETDAWWFDNVRGRIDRLQSPVARAIASNVAIGAGRYVLSFTDDTRELRQPLSHVFRRLWSRQPEPVNNGVNNTCSNERPDEFMSKNHADLMFLRLPAPHSQNTRMMLGRAAVAEEWLRGGNDFWDNFEASFAGRLGTSTETKSQYLTLVDEMLQGATNVENWAIAHVETGFLSTADLIEAVGKVRRVDCVYTKDFSELTGAKAVIITA